MIKGHRDNKELTFARALWRRAPWLETHLGRRNKYKKCHGASALRA